MPRFGERWGVTGPGWGAHADMFGEDRRDGGQDGSSDDTGSWLWFGTNEESDCRGIALGEVGDRAKHGPVDLVGADGGLGQGGNRRLGVGQSETGGAEEPDHGG